MKIAVMDPRNGDRSADLFILGPSGGPVRKRLGYVPEMHYIAAAGELVIVETKLGGRCRRQTRNWLKRFRADTLELVDRAPIPDRPMYAGFGNRSTRIACSPAGDCVYVLGLEMIRQYPQSDDVFRMVVLRYDCATRVLS